MDAIMVGVAGFDVTGTVLGLCVAVIVVAFGLKPIEGPYVTIKSK